MRRTLFFSSAAKHSITNSLISPSNLHLAPLQRVVVCIIDIDHDILDKLKMPSHEKSVNFHIKITHPCPNPQVFSEESLQKVSHSLAEKQTPKLNLSTVSCQKCRTLCELIAMRYWGCRNWSFPMTCEDIPI